MMRESKTESCVSQELTPSTPMVVRDYFGVTWLCLLPILRCHAWLIKSSFRICLRKSSTFLGIRPRDRILRLPPLDLVPIQNTRDQSAAIAVQKAFRSKLSCRDDYYTIGVVEETDFVELAKLMVEAFGAEVVRIGSDANEFEKMMIAPAVDFLNGTSSLVAFVEVMAGLRSRLRHRSAIDLSIPDVTNVTPKKQDELASKQSLVYAVSHQESLIAAVELRLQPCDAKIPFSFPSIDTIERNMAKFLVGGFPSDERVDFQPYLSNLCVAELHRGKGIGRALVSAVETTTSRVWGCERVYLHVDPENKAALHLYKSQGYSAVAERWTPFWAGTSSRIVYLVKPVNI